ncbi:MAG TPA: hypothetical protein VLR94_11610 [Acidobacteriota bacterium]|nr:hypothetical protein [Acidobacteriota bacterium]
MSESNGNGIPFTTFEPTPQQIHELIDAARNHPLGVEFLLEGDLASVAAVFEAHAFTIEAARDHLKETE